MSAPPSRRPLPALIFIGALTVLTALVWFRVLNRTEGNARPSPSTCVKATAPVAEPTVLPYPKRVSVLLLNASNRDGLAAKTQKVLRKRGFVITQIGNDGPTYGGQALIKGVGQIRYGPQARLAATLLHYYLPAAVLKATDSSSATVTLSLGTTYKQVRTKPSVLAQLKADAVTLSTRPGTPAPTPSASC